MGRTRRGFAKASGQARAKDDNTQMVTGFFMGRNDGGDSPFRAAGRDDVNAIGTQAMPQTDS